MSGTILEQNVDERGNITVRASHDVQILTREEAKCIEVEYERMQDENQKLRELLRAARQCVHSGASCSDCRLIAGGCTLQTAMRALGI